MPLENGEVAPDTCDARGGGPPLGNIPLDGEALARGRHFRDASSVTGDAPRTEAGGGVMARQKRKIRGQLAGVTVVSPGSMSSITGPSVGVSVNSD